MTPNYNNKELVDEFSELVKTYDLDDKTREKIINNSREIIKFSKQAIYATHRDNVSESEKLLDSASEFIKATDNLVGNSSLKEIGAFRASLEEFIEAKAYLFFVNNGKIPTQEQMELPCEVHYETYLLALSDFSGELVRSCVTYATNDKPEKVKEIFSVLEELYGLFLQFDFRTGELRKKFDALRYNLSKVQTIVYELHMRKN